MRSNYVKIQVEHDSFKETFEGDVDEVFKALLQFLYTIYPQLEVASKLIWTPDLKNTMDKVSEYGKLTHEGNIILIKHLPSTEQEILLTLTLAYLSKKIGKRKNEYVESREIFNVINKAEKTIRNTLAELIKSGDVERMDKGLYRITAYGLRGMEENLEG